MWSTWQFVPTSLTTGTGSVSQTIMNSVNQFTFLYDTSGTSFTFTYAA